MMRRNPGLTLGQLETPASHECKTFLFVLPHLVCFYATRLGVLRAIRSIAVTTMRTFVKLIGFGLLMFSIYLLGHNILFTTNVSPYWWRGIAADASVVFLTIGVLSIVFLPSEFKEIGWVATAIGILAVFMSSRAILNPTSLWEFFLAFMVMAIGYKLFSTGRIPLL